MFLKTMIALIFTNALWATELEVTSNKINFHLSTTEDKITLKGSVFDLNMAKSACNEKIIHQFNFNIESYLNKKIHRINKTKNDISYKFNGASYFDNEQSPFAQKLLQIPSEMQRLKLEESDLCKK